MKGTGKTEPGPNRTDKRHRTAQAISTRTDKSRQDPLGDFGLFAQVHLQVLQQPPLPAWSRSYRHADLCEHHKRVQFPVTKTISPRCMALSRNYPSPKHLSRRGICRARSPTCCRRCNGLPSCQAEATHPGHIQLGRPILLTAARLKTTRLSLSLLCHMA